MRATVSFLMLLLLLPTPVTHVLAQVAQPQEVVLQPQPTVVTGAFVADTVRVERVIIGVPQLDPNGSVALLLAPAALDLTPMRDSLRPMLTPTPISTPGKVAIVVGAIVVAAAVLVVAFVCSGEEWC